MSVTGYSSWPRECVSGKARELAEAGSESREGSEGHLVIPDIGSSETSFQTGAHSDGHHGWDYCRSRCSEREIFSDHAFFRWIQSSLQRQEYVDRDVCCAQ